MVIQQVQVQLQLDDFAISGFSVNTQNGSITSNPKVNFRFKSVPSLTVSYVSSPFR